MLTVCYGVESLPWQAWHGMWVQYRIPYQGSPWRSAAGEILYLAWKKGDHCLDLGSDLYVKILTNINNKHDGRNDKLAER